MTVNAAIIEKGTSVSLETSGSSIANNALVAATTSYSIFTDGGGRPHGRFVMTFAYATAPTEGRNLAIWARPLNISGTNDAEVPEAARGVWICNLDVNNVTTTQYAEAYAENLPWEAQYYPHNNGSGQTVSAGWTLAVDPYTYAPSTT